MNLNMVKLSEIIPKATSGEWGDDVGEIKVLRTTNFQNDGTINYSNVVTRSISQKKIDQKALKFGDTIIEKSGGSPSQPVGRVVYFDKQEDVFLCNNFTSILRPSSTVDSKYVFWFLFNNHLTGKTLNYQNKTTGIINLKLERYLQELKIPLPLLPIQKRIAEVLDKADALRKKDRQLLQYYHDLAQSLFIDMFGDPGMNEKAWEFKTVGEVCFYVKDGPHVSPKYSETGIPFISVNNIIKGSIDTSNAKYITEDDFKLYSKKGKPEKGDILYTKGGTTGFAKRVDVDFEFMNWVHIAILKFDKKTINEIFFESMLNSNFCYVQSQRLTKGIANRDLVLGEMKKIRIIVPPIDLQKQFAQQIQNIEQQKEKAKLQLQQSENLFQALLQQAFSGSLN